MNIKKSALLLSFTAAMSLLNNHAFAIDMSTSQIIKTTGKVSVKKTNAADFKKLNSNLKLAGSLKNLNGGDKVRTFNNSTADLALKDTCILMVKEQSIFEVPQVLTQKDLKTLLAQQGSILFKVAKGSNFQVQTADVICGVKGTMFSVTIVDPLNTILETPGLQLGYANAGGTLVEVYEGEVEVTHRKSNQKKLLKAGEKLFAKLELKKDEWVSAAFDPKSTLRSKYNDVVSSYISAKDIKAISDVYDKIGNSNEYTSKIYYDNEVLRKINDMDTSKYLSGNKYGITKSDLTNVTTVFSKGEKYKANFSRFTPLDNEKSFYNNSFGEVYLGNSTFAACKASQNSNKLLVEPSSNGLIFTEGTGLVKIDTFNDKLSVINEFLANVYSNGDEIITVVRNNNNNLSWREPGVLEVQNVPNGDNAYIYNTNTCKGYWKKVSSEEISDELTSYSFTSLNSLKQEKERVEAQNKAKKNEAKKSITNKVKNNENVKKGLGKLKGKFKFK